MHIPTKNLLGRAGEWGRGELDSTERRLLFVALLKSTDLVDFRCPAAPPTNIIQTYMELLIKCVNWKEIAEERMPLPRFAITHETRELTNVGHWLGAWNDARRDWENRGATWAFKEKLRLREKALLRLIQSPGKTTNSFAGTLSKWALEASNAPSGIREYWTSLFHLRDNLDIYKASTTDLEELLEWMQDNLQVGSLYSFKTFEHLHNIMKINKGGLTYGLGMGSDEEDFDPISNSQAPFTIIRDSIETYNMEMAAALAPELEPKKEQFNSIVDYLRAKARWTLAQAQLTKQQQLEKLEKEKQQELELDNDQFADLPDSEQEDSDIEAVRKLTDKEKEI